MSGSHANEYECEPVKGLPEKLPEGESMLWQGEPNWRPIANRAFHFNSLGIYFAALIALHLAYRLASGDAVANIVVGTAWQVALAATALGVVAMLGWAYARSTVYTVTNQRVVMRFGVALPMMVNIPWDLVESADIRRCKDGTGDIALTLKEDHKFSYMALWPFARPRHIKRVQPMLRGVADPDKVVAILAQTAQDKGWHERTERATATHQGAIGIPAAG
ncbi:photosynthetic complex assembly protein [Luminiphilus syltensis NOR5-1B]|uniref:Photosynthetic complex assembly protein n=1 Tax=Luminiphilus syltensis NOR5-1B TaxID=565045 RepID=B8KT33_9GAMM|nr:photosynthetic complex putative assembly protein PuhB [Luminiphilus syltensis]EED35895.1 photosynthetic complex assembly protein [Luminiphilus syltensis NOR5-1B]